MYNRYIPQPDGSFRRSRIPDTSRTVPRRDPPQREEGSVQPPEHSSPIPPPETIYRENRKNRDPKKCPTGDSVGSFLKHLLPKDFDTGDLLIILLLLLMAGDCTEDQNTALLTLVLYLFM